MNRPWLWLIVIAILLWTGLAYAGDLQHPEELTIKVSTLWTIWKWCFIPLAILDFLFWVLLESGDPSKYTHFQITKYISLIWVLCFVIVGWLTPFSQIF
jgi:hypothetical protein